ncbi:dehydratase [Lithospermum erythrorhizon]|uniref:Dehydratase n=1 Tax=Lithospermum erythrorhizon TaxID=34254 RepID=A0AAV3RBP3_LITER
MANSLVNLSTRRGRTSQDVFACGYVHIDDVALCHILLFENENVRGRYICNAKVLEIGELVSILAPRFPTLPIAKMKSLGMKFKSIEDMFDDCVVSLVEQGHQLDLL